MTDNVTPIRRRRNKTAKQEAEKPATGWSSLAMEEAIMKSVAFRDHEKRTVNPFEINRAGNGGMVRRLHPENIIPKDVRMALDDAFGSSTPVQSWAWENLQAVASLGMVFNEGFLGFPALAALSQKPEHRRIAETLSTEMTRKWIKLSSVSKKEKADDRLKELRDEMDRLKIRDLFRQLVEHDSYFGRAHIYVDFGTGTDAEEMTTPIGNGRDDISKSKVKKGSIRGFRAIEPMWAYPNDYSSTDPLDPAFYTPQTWYLSNKKVHRSRLLTLIGRPVSDMLKPAYSFGGIPMIQIARLYVDRWEKICTGIAKLIDSFSTLGIKTKLAEAMATNTNTDNLLRRIQMWNAFRSNFGSLVMDKEEEMFNVITPLGTLDKLQAQSQEQIAGISGLPLLKYCGLSPTGLNATAEPELRSFYDWVHASQERLFSDPLDTVMGFAMLNLWGEVDPDITYSFEPLWTSSELEKSQIRSANATTDKTYVDSGAISATEVRKKITNDDDMPYAGLDFADAPELSEAERADSATKMATPILSAFSEGIIDAPKALEELAKLGIFKTVDQAYIDEHKEKLPDLDDGLLTDITRNRLQASGKMGQQQPNPGDPGGGGGPPGGGGGPAPPPSPAFGARPGQRALPPPKLATAGDERPFDLGRLSKTDTERLLRALEDGDLATVRQILTERELHRGAWDIKEPSFTVYHGTPYDIERFDAEHIGTGTGRAHYGEGLYFASDPKIARWYEDELTDRANLAGKPLHLNAAVTNIVGHVYKVKVKRDPNDFIDWDKPIGAQPLNVRMGIARMIGDRQLSPDMVAGDLIKALPPGSSKKLSKLGVAGVKYLDNHDTGTYNFVVFDPADADIVEKDGQPFAMDDFDPDWQEGEHPRAATGQFTNKGGGVAPGTGHHPKLNYKTNEAGEEAPAQLSWEAAPGMTTKHMPEYHGAPLEVRKAYQAAIEKALNDEKGEDIIAKRLGLKTGSTFSAAGVFQGRVNPGSQGQVLGELGDDDHKKIAAGEALRALLLRQDAWAWSKPQLTPNGKREPFLVPGLKHKDGSVVYPTSTDAGVTHTHAFQAMTPEEQKGYIGEGRHNDDSNYVFRNDKGQVLSRIAARKYAEKEGLLNEVGSKYQQPGLISEHLNPDAARRHARLDAKDANMLDFRMGRTPTEDEAQSVDKALQAAGVPYAVIPSPQGFRVLNVGETDNIEFKQKAVKAIEALESETIPDLDYHLAHSVGGYGENNWKEKPNGESYREAIRSAGPDVSRIADSLLSELGPKVGAIEGDFAKQHGWKPDENPPWKQQAEQPKRVASELLAKAAKSTKSPDDILKAAGATEKVAAAREKLKTAVPTTANVKDGGFIQDDGTYTPERAKLHRDLLAKLFNPDAVKAATPAEGQRPTMTILGGRGGSGKSWLTGKDGPVDPKKSIVIDSDAFKSALPEYQGWNAGLLHEESSHVLHLAAEIAKRKGLNVAFDRTMRSGDEVAKTIGKFSDSHDLHGYYMHAPPEIAAQRAAERFVRGGDKGRFVPPEYVMNSTSNEKNFDDIVPKLKKWGVYDNSGSGGPKRVGGSE